VEHACSRLDVSERRACRVLGQARSTQRHRLRVPEDELRLVARIVELARTYGRYGYRRITALLRWEGWKVNAKRVARIWRQEGLKVPRKQPKRGRLWLADGSCVRRRAERRNHVWSYDFVFDRTRDGRPLRMLTIVDEYTRECLSIDVARRLDSEDVLESLAELFVRRGTPAFLRSDNVLNQKSTPHFSQSSPLSIPTGSTVLSRGNDPSDLRLRNRISIDHSDTRSTHRGLYRTSNNLSSRRKIRALSTRSRSPLRPYEGITPPGTALSWKGR